MSGHRLVLASLVMVGQWLTCLASNQYGTGNSLLNVRAEYHVESDFLRIREFFSGKEYTADSLILRTSAERKGLYFHLPLCAARISFLKGKTIKLEVIDSTDPQSRTFHFVIPKELKGQKKVLLGLTGKDWNETEMNLVAWRIIMLGSQKENLLVNQSSLWAHQK
tara:strand:- start:95 stop:589 length:495 start_codon:yes stop_codon:yes gene_type:complete